MGTKQQPVKKYARAAEFNQVFFEGQVTLITTMNAASRPTNKKPLMAASSL